MPYNEKSRKNLHRFTKENAKEMQALGCIKKKELRAQRQKMEDELKLLLNITKKKKGKVLSANEIKSLAEGEGANCSMQTAILLSTMQRAMAGDMTAVTFIRDTIGEKPTDKVKVDNSVTIESWAKNHKVKL